MMLLRHTYPVRDATVEGRTLDLIAVPFDVPSWVDDGDGPYREAHTAGGFAHLDPTRTTLNRGHTFDDLAHFARGVTLTDDGPYLRMAFRLFDDDPDAERVRVLVRNGEELPVSIGFVPHLDRPETDDDGPYIRRVRVKQLPHVSIVPAGAYHAAHTVAVRAASDAEAARRELARERARAEMRAWREASGLS